MKCIICESSSGFNGILKRYRKVLCNRCLSGIKIEFEIMQNDNESLMNYNVSISKRLKEYLDKIQDNIYEILNIFEDIEKVKQTNKAFNVVFEDDSVPYFDGDYNFIISVEIK